MKNLTDVWQRRLMVEGREFSGGQHAIELLLSLFHNAGVHEQSEEEDREYGDTLWGETLTIR